MRNKLGIALCFIGVVIIVSWIMCCANALAHDTVEIRDGKDVHDAKQEREMNAERGKDSHWHFGAVQSGAWDRCIADSYDEENHEYRPEMCDEGPPPEPPPPPRTTRTENTETRTSTSEIEPPTSEQSIVRDIEDAPTNVPEDVKLPEKEDVQVETPCKPELVPFGFYNRFSIHTLPVILEGIETIADLWEDYDFIEKRDGRIILYIDGTWLQYAGSGDVGDIVLTPHTALIIENNGMNNFKHLVGCRVQNQESIVIKAGFNLVGFPQVPVGYVLPSDFIDEGDICAVIVAHKGELKLVGRAGDSGDVPLRDGQGLGIVSTTEFEIHLSVPSAPSATRQGELTTTWGAMKR